MKNTHIKSLEEIVPPNIRLEIYKEALCIVENQLNNYKGHRDHNSYFPRGLCLLLPLLLWDLPSVYSNTPNENIWNYYETSIAFPELTTDVIKTISTAYTYQDRIETRIKFLTSFIETLTNN